uniref:Ribosomal protein S11 n=1 Tax=Dipterosiphonia australica TaxID=2007208 RepID=UPI0022FD95B0|nr:Ribosomal protein S11 [Dipterosiphonia australica]WAX04236.1 Ribosomal protein S11 [Dipterosiphonia australica]
MKVFFLTILFNQNNIFLTLTNVKGEILFWQSLGNLKIKGLKKLTQSLIKPFIYSNFNKISIFSNFRLHVRLKGFNKCKKKLLKILLPLLNILVLSVSDQSNIPTNGCKTKKKRRL